MGTPMAGIPPVLETDAEDVAWALQTAAAMWRRNERLDAIVWLRRAAQAAGDAEDDDRAFTLAREAAELAEWMARNPQNEAAIVGSLPPHSGPHHAAAVDDLLRASQNDEYEIRVSVVPVEPAPVEHAAAPPLPPPPSPPPPPPVEPDAPRRSAPTPVPAPAMEAPPAVAS